MSPDPVGPRPQSSSSTIAEVIERLTELDTELPPDDGVRWFNRLYLAVTRGVAKWLEDNDQASEGFLERLDVLFANMFFEALDAAQGGPDLPSEYPFHAWKPLFERRHRRDVAPLQFALAGMNAHINHDLALGVQQVCAEIGRRPERDSPEYQDYIAVNGLIETTEREVKVWLLSDALMELDRRFGPVDDAIVLWNIIQAREAAWTHAEVLWRLSDEGLVERSYREALDRTTGFIGRALMLPVGFVEGAPAIPLTVDRAALEAILER